MTSQITEIVSADLPAEPDPPAATGPTRRTPPHRWARARWAGVPLTARLLGIMLVLLIAGLAVTGWGTQHVLRDYLTSKIDAELVESAVQVQAGHFGLLNSMGNGSGPDGPTSYAVRINILPGGGQQTQPAGGSVPKLPTLTQQQAMNLGGRPFTVTSNQDGKSWRAVAVPLTGVSTNSQQTVSSAVLALPLNGVTDPVAKVRLLVELFGLLGTLVCGILGWMAIRRAFRPLVAVEETAAAIAAGDLSRRVPEYPSSTEVGRLTGALNGMLVQIEGAFRQREASEARTRRFAADASHELRTPLAAIRGFAELYRQGAVSEPTDVARTMGRIEGEAKRMGGLVEDLLLLARLDEERPGRHDPVDLAVLAGDAVHDARGLAPDRTVQLVGLRPGGGPTPAVVIGDENRLRQVVANLMANAVRHTPDGTPIEVAAGRQDGVGVLEVRDHGSGVSAEHAVRVFERFYRVDSSRSRGRGGGSGLGLSIVAAVVASHGGRVGVAPTAGHGATFRVELPLATQAQSRAGEISVDLDA